MRILLVRHLLPYPPNQGTRIVTFNLIKVLSREHRITLVTKIDSEAERGYIPHLERYCEKVVPVFATNKRSILHRALFKVLFSALASIHRKPLKLYYASIAALGRAAAAESAVEEYDLAQFDYWYCAGLSRDVRAKRRILVEHDIDYEVSRIRERALGRGGGDNVGWKREKELEEEAWRMFDAVLTLSEHDSDIIRQVLGTGKTVKRLPLFLDQFRGPRKERPSKKGHVLFVGSFAADFNVDALLHFLKKMWPLIRRDLPDVSLFVAGSPVPREAVRISRGRSVQFLGHVDDIRRVVSEASVLVVPLRFGGGIRIRILEAMACGTAVVSTGVGASGIEAEPGRHLLIADGEGEFAGRVVELCRSDRLRNRIETEARAWFEENYRSERVKERILDIYSELQA